MERKILLGNIFDKKEVSCFFELIYEWMAGKTPGEKSNVSRFEFYSNKIWDKINKSINFINNKKELNVEEKYFMEHVCYTGEIYRVLKLKTNLVKSIQMSEYYQSWSSTLSGINDISVHGKVCLVIAKVHNDFKNAINLEGLLCYLYKYYFSVLCEKGEVWFNNICSLLKYMNEEEICYIMDKNTIKGVYIVDKKDIFLYKEKGKCIF